MRVRPPPPAPTSTRHAALGTRTCAAVRGRTEFVGVEQKLPVLLPCWTAMTVVGDDQVCFDEDVSKRDAAELAALDGLFMFDPRAVAAARDRGRP